MKSLIPKDLKWLGQTLAKLDKDFSGDHETVAKYGIDSAAHCTVGGNKIVALSVKQIF